jgi:hypothetical protein
MKRISQPHRLNLLVIQISSIQFTTSFRLGVANVYWYFKVRDKSEELREIDNI